MIQSQTPVGTEEVANAIGCSRVTAWRVCRDNIGFAFRFGKAFKVPLEHIERVKRGETPAQIAASYRSNEQEAA